MDQLGWQEVCQIVIAYGDRPRATAGLLRIAAELAQPLPVKQMWDAAETDDSADICFATLTHVCLGALRVQRVIVNTYQTVFENKRVYVVSITFSLCDINTQMPNEIMVELREFCNKVSQIDATFFCCGLEGAFDRYRSRLDWIFFDSEGRGSARLGPDGPIVGGT